MLNALPSGLEPDKSSPRTAVGVAVPFNMQTALIRCANGARAKQWHLHTLAWRSGPEGSGPA